jgi:protein SCO1/2
MNKKIVLSATLFIVLLVAIPLVMTMLFSRQTSGGKIEIDQEINAPYLNPLKKKYTLVFFGYVGCTRVCTPILHQLAELYDSNAFQPLKPYVGVSFVNLMPELSPDQPQIFAHSFNPDFEGIFLTQKELMGVDRSFNLFFSKSLIEKGEIDHSDSIYLLYRGKDGKIILKRIYSTHPLDQVKIIEDIKQCIKELP